MGTTRPGRGRRPGHIKRLGTTGVNVMFSIVNLSIRGGEEREQFKVSPKT